MSGKISKGCLVRLNNNICFTTENGGMRKYPMINGYNDEQGTVEGTRIPTIDEIEDWYDSLNSKGMTSSGESKLPPTAYSAPVYKDRLYTVIRARTVGKWGYSRHPGQSIILDTETGHEIYVKRDLLEAV